MFLICPAKDIEPMQGSYVGQTICARTLIRFFDRSPTKLFGLHEQLKPVIGYWRTPDFSLDFELFQPNEKGEQVCFLDSLLMVFYNCFLIGHTGFPFKGIASS